ncbi:hypothetical protein EDD85DRAFT_602761 [Armillaria nabsnona]|nr:hypothetical protein EDD85DRAFT_602761 [Armillaria nabsnona]
MLLLSSRPIPLLRSLFFMFVSSVDLCRSALDRASVHFQRMGRAHVQVIRYLVVGVEDTSPSTFSPAVFQRAAYMRVVCCTTARDYYFTLGDGLVWRGYISSYHQLITPH